MPVVHNSQVTRRCVVKSLLYSQAVQFPSLQVVMITVFLHPRRDAVCRNKLNTASVGCLFVSTMTAYFHMVLFFVFSLKIILGNHSIFTKSFLFFHGYA